MIGCEKRVSTANGVLTCDKPAGHDGMHHAAHDGGLVPVVDRRIDPSNTSPVRGAKGEPLMARRVEALDVEWPQEGMNDPVVMKKAGR